jgi:hypothetical protein
MNTPASDSPAPVLPPSGQTVLLRVADKAQVREVLFEMLAAWSGRPRAKLPVRETTRGPRWIGPLADDSLDISLSYCGREGWIGLLRGGLIGIDVMRVEPFPEAPAVARHYLDPEACAAIPQSSNPERAFALAWTELEARLKCLKRDLIEWSPARAAVTARCVTENFVLPGNMAISVAVLAGYSGDASSPMLASPSMMSATVSSWRCGPVIFTRPILRPR